MATSAKPTTETLPHLKLVRIRDYAPLRDAKVDFKPGLNIIIGKNGAGKTRFLTLLSELADLREQKEHFGVIGCEVVFAGLPSNAVEAEVTFREKKGDELAFLPQEPQVRLLGYADASIGDARNFLSEPTHLKYFLALHTPVLIRHGTPTTGLPVLDESAEVLLEKRSVTVTLKDGTKRIDDLNSQFVQTILRSLFRLVRLGFTVIRGVPVPPMTGEEVRYQLLRLMAAYTERLTNYLPLYSPVQAVRCADYFQVYYKESQDQYSIKGLVFEYQVNDQWLSFGLLSDGTKRLVYTLAEILAPEAASFIKATNEIEVYDRQKIILLEEPELGIHPHQLHLLLNFIREVSRENQVILTTHAPQVLDMLTKDELDRITLCRLDAERGTQFYKLSEEKQEQARIYMREVGFLSDYWRYSYLEETEAE